MASLCLLALPVLTVVGLSTTATQANVFGDYLNSRYAESLNDYPQAADLLAKVLQARPSDLQVRRETLRAYIQAGRYGDMERLAVETAEIDENTGPTVRFIHGLSAMRQGDYDKAVEIFSAIEQSRVEKFTIPLALAWAETGRGNFDAAIEHINSFNDQGGFVELKALHKGLILARAGKQTEAQATFLAGKDPVNLPTRTFRAYIRLLVDTGKTEEARNLLTKYMSIYSGQALLEADMTTLMQEGALPALMVSPLESLGDGIFHIASAIYPQLREIGFRYARLAHWIAPDLPATTIFIAGMMEDRQRFEAANTLYDTLPEDSPYIWNVRIQKAENLYALGQTDDAISLLKEMATESPGRYDALVSLGDIYRKEERFVKAAETFDKAISRLNPAKPEHYYIYYYAGMTHERAKQWDKAEPNFLKALELRPGNPNILNYLGYSWIEMGVNIEQAQEMIRQAVDQQRHNGYIVDSLGWVYYKVGKFSEAVDELERAVLLLPQDPTVNDHLGDAYWFAGRQREAYYQWERAAKLSPDDDLKLVIDEKLANGLSNEATTAN